MRIFLAAIALILACASSSGREFVVDVDKQPSLDIRSIKVDGGEVSGVPSGREPDSFSITVTLPDDTCQARITVFFNNPNHNRADMFMNFCQSGNLEIGRVASDVPPPEPLESCRQYEAWREMVAHDGTRGEVAAQNCLRFVSGLTSAGKPACLCN